MLHPRFNNKPIHASWEHEELKLLLALAGTMSAVDIAKQLGRTEAAIRHRAVKQGISLAFDYKIKGID
jgi:hypothetical protein